MDGLSHILAKSLASANLWPALVFLVALVTMASFRTMGNRIAKWWRRELRKIVR
jgi:hypothetical protein